MVQVLVKLTEKLACKPPDSKREQQKLARLFFLLYNLTGDQVIAKSLRKKGKFLVLRYVLTVLQSLRDASRK